MKIRKAVIPAAGFATRFLPVTRSVPKAMLPVLDMPALHYVVEEATQAGIEQVALVASRGQDSIAAYFKRIPELEEALERRGDLDLLERMRAIDEMTEVSLVYQPEALGLGHAVLMARQFVGDEPFAVFLPDDLIWSEDSTIGGMADVFRRYGGSVIAVKEVPDEMVPSLGIIDPAPVDGDDRVSEIVALVEKPSLTEAPSNLAILGRYVLTPEVFTALERVRPGALGEIQLTDALAMLLSTQKAYAYRISGVHVDVGTPLGLLKASVREALQRPDISAELRGWLKERL